MSRDKTESNGGHDDDLCSFISSTAEMLTSLDISDSVTDLTSSDSSSIKTITEDSHQRNLINKTKDQYVLSSSDSNSKLSNLSTTCKKRDEWKVQSKTAFHKKKLVTEV